jgi:CheY-like chemotaxis protein
MQGLNGALLAVLALRKLLPKGRLSANEKTGISDSREISWWIKSHVREGREELNFSEWTKYSALERCNKLESICGVISNGRMPPAAYTALHPARAKPLVLIVDDEVPARELLASYLEPEYQIAMAGSGIEALTKAQELRPDAITLDVLMPGGSGFETLVTLRKKPETANTPIVIISIVDQKRVGFALGAADYLIKPIRKPVLLETIRKHVLPQVDDDSAILLVDDDPTALELLEETLHSAGYETQSVQSGARALEVLSSKLVGAVLLDLLMPGMDGFQVISHVRQEPTLKELPILVMTGKDLTADERDLLRRQTQALFQKNGSWQQQLILEVSRVLQRRKLARSAGHS